MTDRNTTPDNDKEQSASSNQQDQHGKYASPFKQDLNKEQRTETPEEEASDEQQRKEALTERD